MSDVRNEPADGPLRHFRLDRRAVLQSLAGGVGVAVLTTRASAAHVHAAGAGAGAPAVAAADTISGSGRAFLDAHAFDTIAVLGEQIVPGSRAAGVPEFLDRLLAVESTDTQRRFMQAMGAFEREAREAHGVSWKMLTAEQATALLTKISGQPSGDTSRQAFDSIKGAVAETYFASAAGLKELGWNGGVAFAAPAVCS